MAELYAVINAEGAKAGAMQFNKAVDSMGNSTTKTGKKISGLKKILIGTFASAVILKGLRAYSRIMQEQEETIAQLNAGLKSTRGISGQTVASIRQIADEMQDLTRYSDTAIESLAAIGLSFTNITGDVFPKFLRISADVATRMGTDLKNTGIQLAKALNDPVANLGALSRAGIQFSKDQKLMINSMVEANRIADAQNLILAELERQYGGSAEAARDTFGGAVDGLKNAIGDLVKTIGEGGLNDALKETVELMTRIVKQINNFIKAQKTIGMRIGAGTTAFGQGGVGLGAIAEGRKAGGFELEFVEPVADLTPKLEESWDVMKELTKEAEAFGDTISGSFENAIFTGQSLSETLKQLGADLTKMIFRILVTEKLGSMIAGGMRSGGRGGGGIPVNTGQVHGPEFVDMGGTTNINVSAFDVSSAFDLARQIFGAGVGAYPNMNKSGRGTSGGAH